MNLNPELQRHVWLELGSRRTAMALGVLGVLFTILWIQDQHRFGEATGFMAFAIFLIANYFYGSHQAGDSLVQELSQHTWDGQRLAAQSAWSLAWGKIIGANLFVWLISGVALFFLFLSLGRGLSWITLGVHVLKLVGFGLVLHTASLVFALLAIRNNRTPSRRYLAGLRLVMFLLVLTLYFSMNVWLHNDLESLVDPQRVWWYDHSWHGTWFVLISLGCALIWLAVAAWRLMEEELQTRQSPWLWLLFNLFLAGYLTGFELTWEPPSTAAALRHGFLIVLTLAYGVALLEPKDFLQLRKLVRHLQNRAWSAVPVLLPCWLVSLLLLTVWMLVLLVTPSATSEMLDPIFKNLHGSHSRVTYVALWLFLLRDLGMVWWIHAQRPGPRAASAVTVFFLLAYLLLPTLVTVVAGGEVMFLFLPNATPSPTAGVVGPLLEVVAVAWLLARQYRTLGKDR